MQRRVEPEVIDDPSTPMAKLEYLLECVRMTNSRLGGTNLLLDCLKQWSARWPRGRAITMLDIGTGSADLPLAAVRWARESGFDLRVTGIDLNERVLSVARRLCAGEPWITLEACDAMDLCDPARSPFGEASFDYVHSGMFIHHLDNDQAMAMVRAMDRIARAGIVWNDLIRSRRGYAVSWLVTLGREIRHDCLASLRAGFQRAEVEHIKAELGLGYAHYREEFLYQRFTLSGERAGVWSTSNQPIGSR